MGRTTHLDGELEIESGDGTILTDKIGFFDSASNNIDNNTETSAGIGGGANYDYNNDGVVQMDGSQEARIIDLSAIPMLFGTYTDNGDGTWSGTLDDELPIHNAVRQTTDDTDTENLEFVDVKFGSFTLDISKGEEVSLSLDWMAKDVNEYGSAITTAKPSLDPLMFFNAHVELDGTAVGDFESVSIDYDRDLEANKPITQDSSGEKRKPKYLDEKMKNLSVDLTIEVNDTWAWKQATNIGTAGDGNSIVEDERDDHTLAVVFDNGDKIELTGVRVGNVETEEGNEGEIKTADLTANALAGTLSGST